MGRRVCSIAAKNLLALMAVALPASAFAQDASPAAPSLVPAQDIDAAGATLTVTPLADWIVTAEGSAWVTASESVKQLDGDDGSELADIPVPGETCLAMDVGFDSVWVGACQRDAPSLVRIDPATASIIATISLPIRDLQAESSVAAGEGAVWVVDDGLVEQLLVQVDPLTDSVIGTFPLPGGVTGVTAGEGGIWIAKTNADMVLHVDPSDGSIVGEIPVGVRPRHIVAAEGAVWVMNDGDGTVSRIDPASDTVTATIAVSTRPVIGGDISVGAGSVWARVTDQLAARIDPASNEVVARYGPPSGSGSVAADDEAAWISSNVTGVWRLPLE
jgi:YVTN family beta-propeller protein